MKKKILNSIIVLLLILVFASFSLADTWEGEYNDPFKVTENVLEYGHDLTYSNNVYIMTGDEYWKNNYNEIRIKCDNLIHILKENSNDTQALILFEELDNVTHKISDIELKSQSLFEEGKRDEAENLVNGSEYKGLKREYERLISYYLKIAEQKYKEITLFSENISDGDGVNDTVSKDPYLDIALPTSLKDKQHIDYHWGHILIGLIGLLLSYFFIFSVDFKQNSQNLIKPFFIVICASMIIVLMNLWRMHATNIIHGVLAAKFMIVGWIAIIIALMRINYGIFQIKTSVNVKRGFFLLIISMMIITFFTNWVISGSYAEEQGLKFIKGPFFLVIASMLIGIAVYTFIITINYRKTIKTRFKISFILALGNLILVSCVGIVEILDMDTDTLHLIIPLMIMSFVAIILFSFGYLKRKRNTVLITLTFSVLIIMGLFVLNSYQTTKIMKTEKISSDSGYLSTIASSETDFIEYLIEEQEDKIRMVTTQNEITNDELEEIKRIDDEFYEISVINKEGIIVASSNRVKIGLNKSDSTYFFNGRNDIYIDKAHYSEEDRRNIFTISYPYKGGVVVEKFDLIVFGEKTRGIINLGETGEILLAFRNINGDTQFFTERKFGEGLSDISPKENIALPMTQALLKNEKIFLDSKDYREVPVVAVTRYISEIDVGLVVKKDRDEILAPITQSLNDIWYLTMLIILALIGVSMVFNYLLTKTLQRQVKEKTILLDKFNDELEETVEQRTKQLNKEKKKVEILLENKTQFINQLSHDLKTPLTPLKIILPLVLKKEKDKEKRELMNRAIKNLKILVDLVMATLNLARLDRGKISFDIKKIDLHNLIKEIINENKDMYEKENMIVINKINKKIIVNADTLRIREVIENLMSNSMKYSDSNKKIKKIIVDYRLSENRVTVSIKDNGMGVKKEFIKNIFNEYFKTDPSRHAPGSLGLGLSICKRIINKHRGRIWAESQGEGKGVTIYFTLPLFKQ